MAGQFPEPMAIAIPHCGPRLYPGREAMVKMRTPDGQIYYLSTIEVFFDDIKVQFIIIFLKYVVKHLKILLTKFIFVLSFHYRGRES